MTDVVSYFTGGHTVTVPKEGYGDIAVIPECEPKAIEEAVATAVERGNIWLTNGPASVFREEMPTGILTPQAKLNQPPEPISMTELTSASIPNAWKEDKTTAFAIVTAFSTQKGKPLPWSIVKRAIDSGIQTQWLEIAPESSTWPCDQAGAKNVVIQVPANQNKETDTPIRWVKETRNLTAKATLEPDGIQESSDKIGEISLAAVGYNITFNIQIDLSMENQPDDSTVEQINSLLSEISEGLRGCVTNGRCVNEKGFGGATVLSANTRGRPHPNPPPEGEGICHTPSKARVDEKMKDHSI